MNLRRADGPAGLYVIDRTIAVTRHYRNRLKLGRPVQSLRSHASRHSEIRHANIARLRTWVRVVPGADVENVRMNHETDTVPEAPTPTPTPAPEPEVADDGFAPTRFFTGHFATQVATQRKRRQRKIARMALIAGAGLVTIAALGLAASIASL